MGDVARVGGTSEARTGIVLKYSDERWTKIPGARRPEQIPPGSAGPGTSVEDARPIEDGQAQIEHRDFGPVDLLQRLAGAAGSVASTRILRRRCSSEITAPAR